MWYLSRAPPNLKSSDHSNLSTLINSIFPVSDSGLFTDICIIEVPNKSLNESNNKEQTERPLFPTWEWFAYLFSPTQFRAVAVANPSEFRIQVIRVLPQHFLCAKLVQGPEPFATLCTYSCTENSLHDVPKMKCPDRNLFGAACALLDDQWLYIAGGLKGKSSDIDPSYYLNSAEQLNLKTWQWEALPNMRHSRAFSSGISHKGWFLVVGGCRDSNLKHSVEIFNPRNKSWVFGNSFVPQEVDSFTATSFNGNLMVLTWSDQLGVKLWHYRNAAVNPTLILMFHRSLISYLPCQKVEMRRVIKEHGARMISVRGQEVWLLVGENERICQVDRSCDWSVFPAPVYRPSEGHEVLNKGYVYAFSVNGVRISWRQIPVYSI